MFVLVGIVFSILLRVGGWFLVMGCEIMYLWMIFLFLMMKYLIG